MKNATAIAKARRVPQNINKLIININFFWISKSFGSIKVLKMYIVLLFLIILACDSRWIIRETSPQFKRDKLFLVTPSLAFSTSKSRHVEANCGNSVVIRASYIFRLNSLRQNKFRHWNLGTQARSKCLQPLLTKLLK